MSGASVVTFATGDATAVPTLVFVVVTANTTNEDASLYIFPFFCTSYMKTDFLLLSPVLLVAVMMVVLVVIVLIRVMMKVVSR